MPISKGLIPNSILCLIPKVLLQCHVFRPIMPNSKGLPTPIPESQIWKQTTFSRSPLSYISCKQSGNNSLYHLELKQRYQQRLEKRPPKPNLILLTTSVHQFGQDAIKRYDKLPSQIFNNMKLLFSETTGWLGLVWSRLITTNLTTIPTIITWT